MQDAKNKTTKFFFKLLDSSAIPNGNSSYNVNIEILQPSQESWQ